MKVYYYCTYDGKIYAIALHHAVDLQIHCFRHLTRPILIVHDEGVHPSPSSRTIGIGIGKIQAMYDVVSTTMTCCQNCIDDLARILSFHLVKEETRPAPSEPAMDQVD